MSAVLAILGALCAVYGISIMLVWSGTSFFAVWLALGALLLLGAWAVHAGWWNACPALVRRCVYAVVAVALIVCAVTQGLALTHFSDQGEDDLDYIIVLGAQVREDGPSVVLRHRLDTAYEYLAANPNTICIVSGGQGPNEPEPEARTMARYLEQKGIASARIIQEDKSLNTIQNILNSMSFIDPDHDRVGIVTNNFHVYRGVSIARKQGIAHVCGIAAPSHTWYLPNNLLRETFGITKDFLKGNL